MLDTEIAHAEYRHDTDPGPCPGCPNFARCARDPIACEAFAAFASRGSRWQSRSRLPLASTYGEIFRAADLPRAGGMRGARAARGGSPGGNPDVRLHPEGGNSP